MEKGDLLADRHGHIWLVQNIYKKPSALLKCIHIDDEYLIDEIDNLKKLEAKKIN